jgi:hypothetical protein
MLNKNSTCTEWVGDTALVGILFDDSDRVLAESFLIRRRLEQTPLDRLQWQAKRQWHRWFPD